MFGFGATAQLGTNTSQTIGAPGGLFPVLSGGTNNIAFASTNTIGVSVTNVGGNGVSNVITFPTLIIPCQYQKDLGLEFIEACITGGTNVTSNGVTIYALNRSFDNGNTFETTPYRYLTNTPPTGAFTNIFDYDVPVTNATHLAITQTVNTGTTAALNRTNLFIYAILKNNTTWQLVPAGSH